MLDDLTNWLMAMVQPIVVRIMTSLGLGVVTFKGVETAFAQARQYVQDGVNSFPAPVLEMFGLFGVDKGLGLILGAMSFALSLYAVKKLFSFIGITA